MPTSALTHTTLTRFWKRLAVRFTVSSYLLLIIAIVSGCTDLTVEETFCETVADKEANAFVLLPDTQFYSCYYEDIFRAQTRWIAENHVTKGIGIVLHTGDVVDADIDAQWAVAAGALHRLKGCVPYLLVTGNHDIDETRDTLLNSYFKADQIVNNSTEQIVFKDPDRVQNAYAVIDLNGTPWLFIGLEFGPRDETLEWANDVIQEHSQTPVVLFTHAYLDNDGRRYDRRIEPLQPNHPDQYYVTPDQGIADGQDIWETVIEPNENVRLVLSGHVIPEGVARSVATRSSGSVVHEILTNYQRCALCPCPEVEGGGGYLRIFELDSTSEVLRVSTYSPFYNRYLTDAANAFELRL